MSGLFITGATGLIGRRLLQMLPYEQFDRVICLSRSETGGSPAMDSATNLTVVRGDLFDGQVYGPYLRQVDTVVHLAAITGKAKAQQYFTVNHQATGVLLEQCRQAGVKNFLFVSTIAVRYPDKSNYFYAQSKQQAEIAVQNSGLKYAIVRPTIVLAANAPIWRSLAGLAKLPAIPVFGDGQAVMQPIYVDDVVDGLLTVVTSALFSNEIFELGGPEKITFEQFLLKVRQACTGKNNNRTLHLPLKPLQSLLALLEKPFFSVLPITAGQLSAFGNNGEIQENRLFLEQVAHMKNLDEMLVTMVA